MPSTLSLALAVRDREDRQAGTAFLDLEVPSFDESPSASLWSPGVDRKGGLPSPAVASAAT